MTCHQKLAVEVIAPVSMLCGALVHSDLDHGG